MTYYPEPNSIIRQWDFKHGPFASFPNVMPDLAQAMIYNPRLKVLLNSGYFDLATPFFEGMYEMYHLPIPATLQKNITIDHYYSGHMVYINPVEHKNLHDNVAKFINSTH
jgi:carboxypeptidase C (cathepsin A)